MPTATTRPRDCREAFATAQLATVKRPADGKYLGDWKAGEKIAQSGRGFHLVGQGRESGRRQLLQLPPDRSQRKLVRHRRAQPARLRQDARQLARRCRSTYSKIYNAKAFNVCSEMPRFGHAGALNEKQIKDLVALLLDPASPVNK
jgi:sulfur-oxidizing protein SoxX